MCLLIRKLIGVASVAIALSLVSFAQEVRTPSNDEIHSPSNDKDALQAGTVESVFENAEGRVFDIISPMIPIYDRYPFYDITIRTPERSYVVRYESMGAYYPAAWQAGKQIKFHREKGQLLQLRYDGEFVPARIL